MQLRNSHPLRPASNPPGWLNLTSAFQRFGAGRVHHHAFNDPTKLGDFYDRRASDMGAIVEDPAQPGWPKLVADDEKLLKVFLYPLGLWFAAAVRMGKLRTAYSPKGGGTPTLVDRGWWITDDPMLRFKTGSIDPDEPFSANELLPCWLFVHVGDLSALMNEVHAWETELPYFGDLEREAFEDDGTDCLIEGTAVRVQLTGSSRRGELRFTAPSPPMFLEPPVTPLFPVGAMPAAANDSEAGGLVLAPTDRTGGPGHPSPMHLIEGLMRGRAAKCELQPRIADEAAALVEIYHGREDWKQLARVTPKTVRNRLAGLYRELTRPPENIVTE